MCNRHNTRVFFVRECTRMTYFFNRKYFNEKKITSKKCVIFRFLYMTMNCLHAAVWFVINIICVLFHIVCRYFFFGFLFIVARVLSRKKSFKRIETKPNDLKIKKILFFSIFFHLLVRWSSFILYAYRETYTRNKKYLMMKKMPFFLSL